MSNFIDIDTKGLKQCPYCGSKGRFYIKEQVRGSVQVYYNFKGKLDDNTGMYDCLIHESGKYAYCENCNKRLFEVD